MSTNKKIEKFFCDYSEYHKHEKNLLIHKIAIPFIVFHITAMLGWLPLIQTRFGVLTAAPLVFLGVLCFYFSLDVFLAAVCGLFMVTCLWIAPLTPVWLVWVITIFAWVIQLLGHFYYEKNSPAFFKNLIQLLIGPLFVAAILTGRWDVKEQNAIEQ